MTHYEGAGCVCGPEYREPDVADFLLWQGARARAELFREKVKKHLEAKRGKTIDQAAEAIAEYLHRAAESAKEDRDLDTELRDKLRTILGAE